MMNVRRLDKNTLQIGLRGVEQRLKLTETLCRMGRMKLSGTLLEIHNEVYEMYRKSLLAEKEDYMRAMEYEDGKRAVFRRKKPMDS